MLGAAALNVCKTIWRYCSPNIWKRARIVGKLGLRRISCTRAMISLHSGWRILSNTLEQLLIKFDNTWFNLHSGAILIACLISSLWYIPLVRSVTSVIRSVTHWFERKAVARKNYRPRRWREWFLRLRFFNWVSSGHLSWLSWWNNMIILLFNYSGYKKSVRRSRSLFLVKI